MGAAASTPPATTGNLLLDGLPIDERQYLQPKLRRIDLAKEQVLSVQGEPVKNVYFPLSGLISCRASGSDGETIEIYSIGREGIADPAAVLTGIASVTTEVQIPGSAYGIAVGDLCEAIRHTTELQHVLLKFAYSLAVRMVQAVKCARFHSIEEHLILWLLQAYRAHGRIIPCTHEAIAEALGTRRATVTSILNKLLQRGVIEHSRGRITIANRPELQDSACECFELIKAGLEVDLACEFQNPS